MKSARAVRRLCICACARVRAMCTILTINAPRIGNDQQQKVIFLASVNFLVNISSNRMRKLRMRLHTISMEPGESPPAAKSAELVLIVFLANIELSVESFISLARH